MVSITGVFRFQSNIYGGAFANIVNSFYALTIFAKSCIVDV